MKKSEQVKSQIKEYYKLSYINYVDLVSHLMSNKIDNFESTIKHSGFDKPYSEYYPTIINYDDNSKLIVTGTDVISVVEI